MTCLRKVLALALPDGDAGQHHHQGIRAYACNLVLQAGLLIAETEFALQVESDIAPYKGLLMGLFFMTVGMEISVGLFFGRFRTVIAGILGLLIGKVSTM